MLKAATFTVISQTHFKMKIQGPKNVSFLKVGDWYIDILYTYIFSVFEVFHNKESDQQTETKYLEGSKERNITPDIARRRGI